MERLWIWTLVIGLWLVVSPWVLKVSGGPPLAVVNDAVVGALIAGMALRGIRAARWEKQMGRFWRLVREQNGGYDAPLSSHNGGRTIPQRSSGLGKARK
ncbi:MAG: SPW repeat protein [Nitrospinota bacterium]